MRTFAPALLLGFTVIASLALADTCTNANAKPVDVVADAVAAGITLVEAEFLLYLAWLIAHLIIKRDDDLTILTIRADALTCAADELCLSLKNKPFCYNRGTYQFHTADGTTGNVKTGDYTLPNGKQGNIYHGPYPLMSTTVTIAPSVTPTPTAGGGGAGGAVTATTSESERSVTNTDTATATAVLPSGTETSTGTEAASSDSAAASSGTANVGSSASAAASRPTLGSSAAATVSGSATATATPNSGSWKKASGQIFGLVVFFSFLFLGNR
ncbi:hypothetical protein QBC46DRAFT_391806 [Diplogelasinospora grovesii]|uniref:Uncharacterized protein n=1 Tax=Diplogelasinospora grovesii TaxID=303347 RepID=A0AAN6S2V8_9PEZI|nr:hypothetical protein QBC46DRAFT_391806 [Diplogelasinospora grovesii]